MGAYVLAVVEGVIVGGVCFAAGCGCLRPVPEVLGSG
jgi:hypothetical protein